MVDEGERADVPVLEAAGDGDVPAVVALMNHAYRGNEGGWFTEAGYIGGVRTSERMLRADLAAKPEGAMLLWRGAGGSLRGCVWVEPAGDGAWYLGSLTIDPTAQNAGLGRRLLAAGEAWVRAQGARRVRMTVVNVRDTLIAWYARQGYAPTGEVEPFPYGDARFGEPLRHDLSFVVLAKDLS